MVGLPPPRSKTTLVQCRVDALRLLIAATGHWNSHHDKAVALTLTG